MKKILFITVLMLCSVCLWGQQTIYVIDNVTVDNFDGSQLKGKTIGDYQITTTGKGNKAVTVHAITTVKRTMRSQIIVNDNGQVIMKTDTLLNRFGGASLKSETVVPNFVYVIDGKVVEESEVKNLPTKQIQSVTVVKDSESLKQFNLDGSSSVVNIITKSEDSAKELLKSLPGAKVEEDGTVTINGQSVKKITINGRNYQVAPASAPTEP
ncbi:MAG: hypothetical protein E7125_06275 [Bacteroidales bacterium]|jgi:hypothetical protein|nr:hypothetical protein [Bacteroidales bacterium]